MSRQIILTALVVVMTWGLAAAQTHDIQIKARIEASEVPQNQTTDLNITLQWAGPAGLFDVEEITQPRLTNLTVVGSASTNRVETKNGSPHTIKDYSFILQPAAMGMAYIEPMRITYFCYADSQQTTLQTQRIELKVTEPVFERTQSPSAMALGAIGFVLLVVLLGAYVWWARKRRLANLAAETTEPQLSPTERILRDLQEKIEQTPPEESSAKCEALSKAVRTYIRDTAGFDVSYLPTQELEHELQQSEFDKEQTELFTAILRLCDEAKFARKEIPLADFDPLYQEFVSLLKREDTTPA